jgi:hypothetical protein
MVQSWAKLDWVFHTETWYCNELGNARSFNVVLGLSCPGFVFDDRPWLDGLMRDLVDQVRGVFAIRISTANWRVKHDLDGSVYIHAVISFWL